MDQSDAALLKRFVSTRDDHSFRALVDRYVGMVFSIARRIVIDEDLARDIAQQAFVRLATDARKIREQEGLAPWLHTVTRSLSLNALRGEHRRRTREAAAAEHMHLSAIHEQGWEEVAPEIDLLIASLAAKDRKAVILYYYDCRSFEHIASILGTSADAARKRVERAVDTIRSRLARLGIHTSTALLSSQLTTHASASAPPGLAASVTQAGIQSFPLAAHSLLFTSIITMTTTSKVAFVASVTAAILVGTLTMTGPRGTSANTKSNAGQEQKNGNQTASLVSDENVEKNIKSRRPRALSVSKPKPPRSELSHEDLVKIIKVETPGIGDVNTLGSNLESSFDLLGMTQDDRNITRELVAGAKREIIEAEKNLLKPEKAGENALNLDLTPMNHAAQEVALRLQQSFAQNLPSDLANAINAGVDWGHFYPGQKSQASASFKLIVEDDGSVHASFSGPWGGAGYDIADGTGPEDYSEKSAAEAFHGLSVSSSGGESVGRWLKIFSDIKLTPASE